MLVKVIDHKGKERFVNVMFVKSVAPKGEDQCEIEMSGWATKIRVKDTAENVALTLSAAVPGLLGAMGSAVAAGEEQDQQTQASVATGLVVGL